ncbi:MAG: hypothetical protein LUE12_09435 [Ruminococcus sp.]|nr:hypothetical protein [Ruminococcus sp.]
MNLFCCFYTEAIAGILLKFIDLMPKIDKERTAASVSLIISSTIPNALKERINSACDTD